MSTIRALIRKGTLALQQAGIENGRQEAEWLLAHVLAVASPQLFLRADDRVEPQQSQQYCELLRRRQNGEPLQYILGSVEFFGRSFIVGPGVLIARPETERVTEIALAHAPEGGRICDVCTGSGVIAITLAKELSGNRSVTAIDVSRNALQYAAQNLCRHRIRDLHLVQGDLLTSFRTGVQFTLIVSNPPYIADDEYACLPRDVRDHEPRQALIGGDAGMQIIRQLADQARRHLAPGGWLVMEIGCDQGGPAGQLLEQLSYNQVTVQQDYAGRDRILLGQWAV